MPLSEWQISPGAGRWRRTAMSRASSAISACRVSRMDQPTILRRVQIKDGREVEPALAGAHVGQIGQPHLVRAGRLEVPAEPVGGDGMAVPAVGGAHPARQRGEPPQARAPHQPSHAVAANAAAMPSQGQRGPAGRRTRPRSRRGPGEWPRAGRGSRPTGDSPGANATHSTHSPTPPRPCTSPEPARRRGAHPQTRTSPGGPSEDERGLF